MDSAEFSEQVAYFNAKTNPETNTWVLKMWKIWILNFPITLQHILMSKCSDLYSVQFVVLAGKNKTCLVVAASSDFMIRALGCQLLGPKFYSSHLLNNWGLCWTVLLSDYSHFKAVFPSCHKKSDWNTWCWGLSPPIKYASLRSN